ncbi:MAG TPA: helix-turn-helix domain-containing protein [Dehalococcoidales bacterium]|nr:helix-turn-helix domain-containing protein [Dehalococcoidales bacterium]
MRLELIDGIETERKTTSSTDSNDELDLPPEYHRYRDEGCEAATAYLGNPSSCLNCPFPNCIYDQYGGKQRWLKRLRDKEMVILFTTEGKGIKELALIFGVSQRTVQRALKRSKNE